MSHPEEDVIRLPVASLVERARTGDSDAFEGLYTLYFAELYGYLFGLVRNPEDARDVAQQTFLQAWWKLPSLRDVTRFKHWLYCIARNAAYDYGRKVNRSYELSWDQLAEERMPLKVSGPEERVAQAELLFQALAALPLKVRDCLLLHDIGGFSQSEIAEMMDIGVMSVRTYVSTARKRVREHCRQFEHERENTERRDG
jgi:RNA polymerase sigma-70 factor, ECF subfamily